LAYKLHSLQTPYKSLKSAEKLAKISLLYPAYQCIQNRIKEYKLRIFNITKIEPSLLGHDVDPCKKDASQQAFPQFKNQGHSLVLESKQL